MVGLPYRTDRTLDHLARMLTALGATCGQVPEASPEIGAAEDRVRNYRKQQYYGDRGAHPTGSSD
jgi:hypothetical protein